MMSPNELCNIVKVLNATDFKVLVWSKCERESIEAGLKDCIYLAQKPLRTTGT